jgi:hypothetical protein
LLIKAHPSAALHIKDAPLHINHPPNHPLNPNSGAKYSNKARRKKKVLPVEDFWREY